VGTGGVSQRGGDYIVEASGGRRHRT